MHYFVTYFSLFSASNKYADSFHMSGSPMGYSSSSDSSSSSDDSCSHPKGFQSSFLHIKPPKDLTLERLLSQFDSLTCKCSFTLQSNVELLMDFLRECFHWNNHQLEKDSQILEHHLIFTLADLCQLNSNDWDNLGLDGISKDTLKTGKLELDTKQRQLLRKAHCKEIEF